MNMLRRAFWGLGVGLVAGLAGTAALAGPITDPNLAGATQDDEWTTAGLTSGANPGYGSFPGTGDWPGPIDSTLGGGNAALSKAANGAGGGPLPFNGSMYFAGFSAAPNTLGGTLEIVDATPVGGLANVVFQIQIGQALGFDFYDNVLPVLSYNGESQNLEATYATVTDRVATGTFETPDGSVEPIYTNTHLLQWNLSGISGITEFTISFSGVQHAQVYGLRLDQSDVFTSLAPVAAVPEPTSVALLACGLAAVLYRARKRG